MKRLLTLFSILILLTSCGGKKDTDVIIHESGVPGTSGLPTAPTIQTRVRIGENDPCYKSTFNPQLEIIASCTKIDKARIKSSYPYKVLEANLCLVRQTKLRGRVHVYTLLGRLREERKKDAEVLVPVDVEVSGTGKTDENLIQFEFNSSNREESRYDSEVTYNTDSHVVTLRQETYKFHKNKRYASFSCTPL